MIVAHGNSLRGIVKHIDKLSQEEIQAVGIPDGIPLVYKLDALLIYLTISINILEFLVRFLCIVMTIILVKFKIMMYTLFFHVQTCLM